MYMPIIMIQNLLKVFTRDIEKSFGFVITAPDEEDVYIAEQNKGTAMHNDKVRVRIITSRDSRHKREGVITEVIERAK